MVSFKHILTVPVFAAVLCGCAKEERHLSGTESRYLGINEVTAVPRPTRAVLDGPAFPLSEAQKGIGLFLVDSDGQPYGGTASDYSNVKYCYGENSWKSDAPMELKGEAGTLYGYFPYDPSAADMTDIPVASSLNGTDYMYVNPVTGVNIANGYVNLELRHALARLTVELVADGEFSGTAVLNSISIYGDGVAKQGRLNAVDGTVCATKDTVSFEVPAEEGKFTSKSFVGECLVVPVYDTDDGQSVIFRFVMGGKEYPVEVDGLTVRKGMKARIKIAVKNIGLSVLNVKMDSGDSDNLTVETADGKVVKVSNPDCERSGDIFVDAYLQGSSVMIDACSSSQAPVMFKVNNGGCNCEPIPDRLCSRLKISDITADTVYVGVYYDAAKMARTDVPEQSYYKTYFLNSGWKLDSFSSIPKGLAELCGVTWRSGLMDVDDVEYYRQTGMYCPADSTRQQDWYGNENDLNGPLLYPDGEPRFKVFFNYGGSSGDHGKAVGEKGAGNVKTFYENGGSYVGHCAGCILAGGYYGGARRQEFYNLIEGSGSSWTSMPIAGMSYYTDVELVRGTRFEELCDLDGQFVLDSLLHSGGAKLTQPVKGVEVLGYYASECYPNTIPSGEKIGDPLKYVGEPVEWTYKRNSTSGRVVVCGSHPETCTTGGITKFFKAELLYAGEDFGTTTAKARLFNGEPRVMGNPDVPEYAGLGDNQYHHYVIYLPEPVEELTVNLDWDSRASLDLALKYDSFAYLDSEPEKKAESPFETVFVENTHLSVTQKNLSAGLWYVSVHCKNKVKGERTTMYSAAPGRSTTPIGQYYTYEAVQTSEDLLTLNGVPYTVTASW